MEKDSPVIIKDTVITQAKRLNNTENTMLGSTPSINTLASPIVNNHDINDQLKSKFAKEFSLLQEESRQLGLKQAAKEAVVTLNELKEQLQNKYSVEEKKLQSKYDDSIQQLVDITTKLTLEKEHLFEKMPPIIASMTLEIVCKIISTKAVDKELIELLAKQAIHTHKLKTFHKIYISRKDVEHLQEHLKKYELHHYYHVDEQADIGSCIIELDNGKVDASLKEQLYKIVDLLMMSLESVE